MLLYATWPSLHHPRKQEPLPPSFLSGHCLCQAKWPKVMDRASTHYSFTASLCFSTFAVTWTCTLSNSYTKTVTAIIPSWKSNSAALAGFEYWYRILGCLSFPKQTWTAAFSLDRSSFQTPILQLLSTPPLILKATRTEENCKVCPSKPLQRIPKKIALLQHVPTAKVGTDNFTTKCCLLWLPDLIVYK